ncbi:hypothetical protein AK812_SmicGene605 [Symbiodinium microadriaticum]|uniref:Uncharacterized protein n=1 Tax=Symbiodinium microadriaticum TaxID=2951 RepID=A0A1Q9F624_SYMMI|nr:hypothetical protein AK812_SmicGene605 [Symbiodinium microadriaticum]
MASSAAPSATAGPSPKMDKKAAAQAFTDRLNATPASGSEADRFREADDRLKSLPAATVQALSRFGEAPTPEVVTCMECWAMLHGEDPTVLSCLKLAEDPSEFKLVGVSLLNSFREEELSVLEEKTSGLQLPKPTDEAEQAAAAMLEWLQAGLAMRRWAESARQSA